MIEALNINKINPKALEKVNGEKTQEASGEGQLANEFATALEAMLIPVEGGADLALPSELVNQGGESSENISPKVFNSNLINNVNDLLGPESAEADIDLEGIDPKLLQSFMKTPVVSGTVTPGRAPAVELSNAEVDPQFLNFEDFVEQKNLQAKKPVVEAYGLKINSAEKEAKSMDLKETQVVSESSPVKSQDFILNMLSEKTPETTSSVSTVATAPKVFDMNNIKTTNTNEIINQITDYVVQAKAAKEPTVHMRFNHDDLGMVDLHVSKVANSDSIAVNIGAHSLEGKSFFQQNAKELLSHLASTGHTVTDMKVETPSQMAKSDFDFGSQLGKGQQQGQDKQFGSEQNQRRHEQERRADLWKVLNQEAA